MRNHEHREHAEAILHWLKTNGEEPWFEADHGQVMATMAVAHAMLATVPDPNLNMSVDLRIPINQQEPSILFQGPAAAKRVECARLAAEEAAETKFTKRDAVELAAKLDDEVFFGSTEPPGH